jgi:hypothetical protein
MAKKLTPGASRERELAEESNRRGLYTERDLMREVSAILAAAKWNTYDQRREPRARFGGDMLASRLELGQERRYAIDCVLEVNSEKVRERQSAFRNYIQQSKQPFNDFDEYWIVGYKVSDPMRRNPGNDRHFRVIALDELRTLLEPPKPKRQKQGKAVTKIGKMKAELESIKGAVRQFKKAEIKEKEVVQTVHTFKDSLGKWWNKSHDTIYSSASNSALFLGATGLLHTINADSATALAIAGSLIGGEAVAKVLKSLPRGLFTKHRD